MPSRTTLLIWTLALLFVPASASGAGTQASFSVEKGWVRLTVERNGDPLANARIRVFDNLEEIFAEGETDENGRGLFPTLPDHTCRIGITVDNKECDLIPLRLHGKKAEPERVLLSFGTRPCCRLARSGTSTAPERPAEEDTPPASPGWPWAALAGGACLAGAAFFLVRKSRPSARQQTLPIQEGSHDTPA